MDHYLDLKLRPDPEFPTSLLLNTLAAKLHHALVILQVDDIGISFPRHRTQGGGLGDLLRLHGSAARLQALMQSDWLGGIADHLDQTVILPVPADAKHRIVRRVQVQSNAERIRRRQMKRHGWTEQEARERISDSVEKQLDLPWLMLRSQSTGQHFRLFIEHLPCQASPTAGSFNAYGLSKGASIPWF